MNGVIQRLQAHPAEPCESAAPALPHLYLALTECGRRGAGRPMQGTSAALWQAIDRLQAEGGRAIEIGILEQLSTEIHRLSFALIGRNGAADLAARLRIAALTGEWLVVARLFA
jgi:hypothetical protein